MRISKEKQDELEGAIRQAFEDVGLVSDYTLAVEVLEEETGEPALHHITSANAVGWKSHGMALYMALYMAAANEPEPSWHQED